jgi:hypothetical protein
MTVNNFTTGKDVTIQINTSYGPLNVPPSAILNFQADPDVTKLKSKGIDGTSRHGVIPDSWKGSITIDRLDHSLDDFWGRFEADYYANVASGVGTIIERILEQDGTVSTWRYDGVVITLEKAGDWAADKKVEQTFSFEAAHRIKVT